MTSYVFRIWLLPHPPLEFEPDEEVWRDIEVDGSQTLDEFHEAIFEGFDRWESHTYEFLTRDEDGIATRSYVHPQLYDGGSSWPPMDDDEIEQFIEQAVPEDMFEEARDRFRNLQSDPPSEANAAETTVEDINPEQVGSLTYVFDMGDSWEHYIELQETRPESLDGEPAIVGEQGTAPPQYPDLDE